MTSTPVKDMSSIMNFVGQRGVPAPNNAGNISGGFNSAMSKASHQMNHKQTLETPVNKSQDTGPQSQAAKQVKPKEQISQKNDLENSQVQKENDLQADGQTISQVEEAGMNAVKAVAEELGIPEEEVLAAMEAMGLVPTSLLEPQNLTALTLNLSGQNTLALVTNEELYVQVSELTRNVSEITGQLMEDTGLTPESLAAALEQIAKSAEEASKVISPNDLAKEENSQPMAQEGQEKEITIVIEKDGEITEVTAKTDAKGNVAATKEVSTTPIETAAEENSKGQTGDGQQEASAGKGEGELAGRNSLLETLLQSKNQTVEAAAESVSVLETPDTERIMRQILDYMKIQLKPEMSQLEMQLHPASLGTINVQIASREGVITAQFTAQNDIVKAVIEGQLVELKENMRAQGIKVEAVEVNVQSQSFESNLWQGQEKNGSGYEENKKNTRRINLNELDMDELPEDMTREEQLAAEIMMENGGTVDFTA